MAKQYTSSNEFAALVSELQKSPDDPALKQKVVSYLPYMRELAKTSSLALFHLAHIYHEKSAQYKKMVLEAADQGCTNAMLAACKFLTESKNSIDKQRAQTYLEKIEQSKDSFIIDRSEALLTDRPNKAPENAHNPSDAHKVRGDNYRFFNRKENKEQDSTMEIEPGPLPNI